MEKDTQPQLCHDVVSSTHGNQRRHSSATSVTRGTSPLHKVECTRKKCDTLCLCLYPALYKKNYLRHVRRWHQSESQLVDVEVRRDPIIPDHASIIADSASLFSATENVELLESINAAEELPQLTGDDVEKNIPRAELSDVVQPTEPPSVARQSCKIKQLLLPSAASTAGQPVTRHRGAPAEKRTAAEAVVTSSLLAVETNQQRRPVQSRTPATHRVTSQKVTSPAARIRSWQDDAEKRGSPKPRDVRRSSSSRSPAREAHGYQRRDARRDRYSRSPRRAEHRSTPKSSPPRHFQHERGRDDARRDDRPREREPPDTNEQLFSEFLSFVKRRRE